MTGHALLRASALVAALGAAVGPSGAAQLDLRLDLAFTGGAAGAGGTWELFAEADDFGIFGLNVDLLGIAPAVSFNLPTGVVNGSDGAGFVQAFTNGITNGQKLLANQAVLPQGSAEQGLFYGVGTLENGSPDFAGAAPGTNQIGPSFSTLGATANVPWATAGGGSTEVSVATGSFLAGVTPQFGSAVMGAVFTSLGDATTPGSVVSAAAVATSVTDNLGGVPGDTDGDGDVDLGDLDTLAANFGLSPPLVGGASIGDFDGDGDVDLGDLDALAANFGVGTSLAVPEPSAASILLVAVCGCVAARR